MNKFVNIAVAIAITSFLATNFYLLFSNKSIIPKSVYVNTYERMTVDSYNKKLAREALVAPTETYTVYVGNDDAVDSWLVAEGDAVNVGEELALLDTERAESQRNTWEAERDALLQQETEVNNMIDDLSSERSRSQTGNSSKVDRNSTDVTEVEGRTRIEFGLNVDFTVDVTQEGSYAQAVAAAEQQLADIARQLVVVEAQLAQNPARPAIVSPVEGVVSNVARHGSTLAVDIYSSQKVVMTYAVDNEWLQIEEGDRVLIQGDGIGRADEGTVLSVSAVPAKDDALLEAYETLDTKKASNPLAYYEVRILTDAELDAVPFGNNMNALVITDEAQNAISLKEKWLKGTDEEAEGAIIEESGRAVRVAVTTPFSWKTRAVVTDGMYLGDIVIDESLVRDYGIAPEIFLPMPSYMPTKAEWRAFGWRNYLEHLLIR